MKSFFIWTIVILTAFWWLYFHIYPFFRRLLRGRGIAYVSPKTLDEKIKSHADLVMIDIREDFNDKIVGYINGSISLPYDKFMAKIAKDADSLAGFKDVPVVIVGLRDENESFYAYKTLKQRGFDDVSILDKGITQWLRDGLPTVRPYAPKDA